MADLVLGQWVTIAREKIDVTTNNVSNVTFTISAKLLSQNTASNKSKVAIDLDYSWDQWTACYRTDFYLYNKWKGYADRAFGTTYLNFESWPLSGTLMSTEIELEHDSSGNKSFTIKGGYEFANNGYGPTTFEGTAKLPTINRGITSFTCSPSILTVTGDSSITFSFSDPVSRTHDLSITVGKYSQNVSLPAGTTSYTWTPSKDIIEKIGDASNPVAKAVITTTISGSTKSTKEVKFGLIISDMVSAKISMENGHVTFNMNGIFASFDGLFNDREPIATKIAVQLNQKGSIPLLPFMEIDKVVVSKDTWNQLTEGDVIKVDTEEAKLYKNNSIDYRLGALGNDYETFVLVPGQNQIQCLTSDWVEEEPEFKLKYREVFL